MRRFFIWPLVVGVAAAISATAQTDKLTALQTEVRQLQLELTQQRIEFQQWKIEQLEIALKDAKETRETLEAEERAAYQALNDSSATEGDETTSFRAELTATTLKKLRALQTSAQQRENDLQQKLTLEQSTLQALTNRQRQLRTRD